MITLPAVLLLENHVFRRLVLEGSKHTWRDHEDVPKVWRAVAKTTITPELLLMTTKDTDAEVHAKVLIAMSEAAILWMKIDSSRTGIEKYQSPETKSTVEASERLEPVPRVQSEEAGGTQAQARLLQDRELLCFLIDVNQALRSRRKSRLHPVREPACVEQRKPFMLSNTTFSFQHSALDAKLVCAVSWTPRTSFVPSAEWWARWKGAPPTAKVVVASALLWRC